MANPQISVVSAAWNALEGVRTTVESVAQQRGCVTFEHIVVDGGSSDGTREYLEGQGAGVRWVSEPDEGIGDALNKGIAMARGDYVLVLQAEDYFLTPDSLQRAFDAFDPSADIMSFDVLVTRDDGSSYIFKSKSMGLMGRWHMRIPHQGMFCRRSVFEDIGSFDTSYRVAMDYEFLLRADEAAKRIVSRNVAHTCMPDTGVSSQRDWASLSKRLAENRRAQEQHNSRVLHKLLHKAYWTAYPAYKRMRHKEAWRG